MASFEEKDFEEKINLGIWKKIIKTIWLDKKSLIGLCCMVSLLAVLDVVYPLFNKYAIDHYFVENAAAANFNDVTFFIVSYIVWAFGYLISVTGFLYFAGQIEVKTAYQLRKQAYERLQNLSFSYYDVTPQGWIMARMTSDSRNLASIISWGLNDLLWGLLSMIGILIVLFVTDYRLALIIVCILPFMITIAIIIRKQILKTHRKARKINSQITASFNESFMGSVTTKSLVIEESNEKEFSALTYRYRKSVLRSVFFSALFGPTMFILGYIAVGANLYFGGDLVLKGLVTVSTLYLFIDYSIKFFDPVMQLAMILSNFQQAQASAERIITLIETEPEVYDSPEVIEKYGDLFNHKKENFESINGDIEFKNVTFKYNNGETVLKNFNLKIKAGSSVALVGHTGSGKSTIINLISRFYEPKEGEILIDGTNYKDRSISWLHSNLGYVLQSPQLFSGTIKENIRYGKLDATDEEVINAAKMVNAHDFIVKLEKGYDTNIGEGGNKLSLGEKQLISFARAIIANPAILILDEATSSIDTESERKIQDAISVMMKGRTSLSVAHRLSTIVNSDLILVLDNGIVIEQGTHHELLRQKGYYFTLYRNQFMQEKAKEIGDL